MAIQARRAAALLVGAVLVLGFCGLGVWQLQRLAWKLDLIARTEARIHAPPLPPPGPAAWPRVSTRGDEYKHVRVRGAFDHSRETLVQAVTEAGPGFWVLTPLRTEAGYTVLINRGFVPQAFKSAASRPAGLIAGPTTVTGLVRISEPRGGFLRANQPAADRWYSRDVAAIGQARGLAPLAPYFIDADATPNPGGWPRGGLTVVRFHNSHLVYAMTWFALAAMVLAWGAWPRVAAARDRRRARLTDLASTHAPRT